MSRVLIAFGSNLGDRLANIQAAVDRLAPKIEWLRLSSVYASDPMYLADQPAFLNAAGLGETELDPLALLAFLKQSEVALGREARVRFGPREIDLDLIDYANSMMHTEQLVIPHPRFAERRFVLLPLGDVAPNWPLSGFSVRDWIQKTEAEAGSVRRLEDAVLSIPGH